MRNLWNWYISLFSNEDNKIVIAAWAATVSTLGFLLTFIFKPLWGHLFKKSSKQDSDRSNQENFEEEEGPTGWEGISPPQSNYRFRSTKVSGIPKGPQTFSFEYNTHGHVYPLNLKGKSVRAEIQFTCQITNPKKAMFSVNQYSLNVLQPNFLVSARSILEKYSLKYLRENRQLVCEDIVKQQTEKFDELGFALRQVTLGAIEELKS